MEGRKHCALDGAAGQATLREFTPLQLSEKDGGRAGV